MKRLASILSIFALISISGVYAVWNYGNITYVPPIVEPFIPSIVVFDWIPGMGDEEDEMNQAGANINALVQSFSSDDIGLNDPDKNNALINAIKARINKRYLRDTFGSMAVTSGSDVDDDLQSGNTDKLDWIVQWDADNINNITEYKLFTYDHGKYGELGTKDEGILWWAEDGQHYKQMHEALLQNPSVNVDTVNDNFRDNNGANGHYFGVISCITFKLVDDPNDNTSNKVWTVVSYKEGHARAAYYDENQSDSNIHTTHIPAWDCDSWVECSESCSHVEGQWKPS